MSSILFFLSFLAICTFTLLYAKIKLYISLKHVPGPRLYAFTSFRLAWDAWNARSIHKIYTLHKGYGPIVRVGPRQISFNSLTALKTIYGAGSVFERTSFYRMFDAFGEPNMFTFMSSTEHRNRKRLVAHMYSNQKVMEHDTANMITQKVKAFVQLLDTEPDTAADIFTSLHYFSLDAISTFVYGDRYGGTKATQGSNRDRRLIDDILDPARRRLSWFLVHFPTYTRFIITQTGFLGTIIERVPGILPMRRPFTYSGIRQHALESFRTYKQGIDAREIEPDDRTVIGRLFQSREKHRLGDMAIASECADHLLAGIDTTADSLMFLIWVMSLPQHVKSQQRLRTELSAVTTNKSSSDLLKDLAQLPFLNAVIKEALRLFTPLPSFEPRLAHEDVVIDDCAIPAGTVVGMSPFCMHRNSDVFPEPEVFRPGRWLNDDGNSLLPESAPQNKWFWAFSSGARMCIGLHLANAEMLMLTAAIYRTHSTTVQDPDTAPAITSRYELFHDETMHEIKEHECYINFEKITPC